MKRYLQAIVGLWRAFIALFKPPAALPANRLIDGYNAVECTRDRSVTLPGDITECVVCIVNGSGVLTIVPESGSLQLSGDSQLRTSLRMSGVGRVLTLRRATLDDGTIGHYATEAAPAVSSLGAYFNAQLLAQVTLIVFVQGCAASSPVDGKPGITRACYRSFAPTLDAWEQAVERAPLECAYLDKEYTVQLLHESGQFEVCTPEASAWAVAGCTQPEARTIYLLASGDDAQMTDTSVHEWVHALADCIDGDRDALHLRAQLWADYGPNTVEAQAQANAEIGECL